MRGKYENATKRFKLIQKLTNGKVRDRISTKLKGFARKKRNANEAINGIKDLKKQAIKNNIHYVGFGK